MGTLRIEHNKHKKRTPSACGHNPQLSPTRHRIAFCLETYHVDGDFMAEDDQNRSPYFSHFDIQPFKIKRKGVRFKSITGTRVQLVQIELDPDFTANHKHDNEQVGFVQAGSIEITINGSAKICGKGEAYYIPANVPHSFHVRSKDPAEILEVFSPPKPENKM